MKKTEARWQVVLNRYLREKRIPGFFELKQTTKLYLPFSQISPNQYNGLQATEREGLVWKLSDEDTREKPCDTLSIPPLPSYLVIKFPAGFYFIRIKKVVELRETNRIGITQDEAEGCAEWVLRI